MLFKFHGLPIKSDTLGFEALSHNERGFEMHASGELTIAVNDSVTGDIGAI